MTTCRLRACISSSHATLGAHTFLVVLAKACKHLHIFRVAADKDSSSDKKPLQA